MLNILIFTMIIFILSFIFKDKYFDNKNYFLSYKYTNIMKGIAIILVLINHIGQRYRVSVIEPLGGIGVCIFLILSGYGINEAFKRNGKKNYFKKRFKRVIIPYWIIVLLSSIVKDDINIPLIIKKLILIDLVNGIFWYVRMVVFCYIIFYISKSIKNIRFRYLFIILMSTFISIIFLKERLYLWQIFSFPLGILISDNIELVKRYNEKNFKFIAKISLLISIITIILKKIPYVDSRTFGFCDTILQIIINLSVSIFISTMIYILRNINLWRFIEEIGKKSYEIYLVHPFFLYWLKDESLLSMIVYLITISILSLIFNYSNTFINNTILKENKLTDKN